MFRLNVIRRGCPTSFGNWGVLYPQISETLYGRFRSTRQELFIFALATSRYSLRVSQIIAIASFNTSAPVYLKTP